MKSLIDIVPDDWDTEKIKSFSTTYSGGTPSSGIDEYYLGDIPWVKSSELKEKYILQTEEHITEKAIKESSARYVEPETILFALYGATAGDCAILKIRATVNQAVLAIPIDDDKIDRDFLFYAIKRKTGNLIAISQGGGQPNLSKGIVDKVPISFPKNTKEQQKIASILTKVDEAIQTVKNTIEKAERLKKALMQNLITGKLKPEGTWRSEDEFYEDEKFGKYPKDWSFGRFKEFAVLQRGKDLTDNEVVPGPYPVVKSNGIQIYHNAYFVEPPGVVTGRSGTIGKVFYIDDKFWAHNTSLYIKDFKGNNEKYIYYLILRMKFNQYYAGTTVPTLNRNDIHKVRVAIPKTVDEQTDIVKKIDSVQDIPNNKNLKIQKLKRLKKALMQNLLTGKVRVKLNEPIKEKTE